MKASGLDSSPAFVLFDLDGTLVDTNYLHVQRGRALSGTTATTSQRRPSTPSSAWEATSSSMSSSARAITRR